MFDIKRHLTEVLYGLGYNEVIMARLKTPDVLSKEDIELLHDNVPEILSCVSGSLKRFIESEDEILPFTKEEKDSVVYCFLGIVKNVDGGTRLPADVTDAEAKVDEIIHKMSIYLIPELVLGEISKEDMVIREEVLRTRGIFVFDDEFLTEVAEKLLLHLILDRYDEHDNDY